MNILITGANGFIGKNLIPLLVKSEYKLILYDLNPFVVDDESKQRNIVSIYGDITSSENFKEIDWGNLSIIIHLAAAGVKASQRNWDNCKAVNINGVKNILNRIENLPIIPRLIYPRTFYEDCLDEYEILKSNPYFYTKHLATIDLLNWAKTHKHAKVILPKIFQAYGPGDDSGNVLSYTLKCLFNKSNAELSSGAALRDWIYVDDLISLFLHVINYEQRKHIEYFDFGTGELTTVRAMVEILAREFGSTPNLISFDSNLDREDVKLVSAAKLLFPNWIPKYSIEEGIKQFIKHERIKN